MRSLFGRIFLTFWLATVLIGAVLVALAVTSDPGRAAFRRHEARLQREGRQLVEALEAGRLPSPGEGPRVHLFRGFGDQVFGPPPRGPARRLAAAAAATGERQLHRGRRGLWMAVPVDAGYVAVAPLPPPGRLDRLLDPYGLTLRLGAAFAIVGAVSFFLARSLARPIRDLRRAAGRLAEGDLSARAGAAGGRRRDETAELGREFDRMAERLEALVGSQRRLLRDISHELRSPLARLGVALELARRDAPAASRPALDRIGAEAERLNGLIGELLDLARLDGGEAPLEFAPLDLAEVVAGVVQDARFEARARGRSVELRVEGPVRVAGSAEFLRRAVENVVRNAVRFTAEGTAVEVAVGPAPGGGGRVGVRDRGPGVPPEALGDLFRPFYRVADARDRESGGAGLGLAIAQRAVALHGGAISAENAPGGGLVVRIELPDGRGGRSQEPGTRNQE